MQILDHASCKTDASILLLAEAIRLNETESADTPTPYLFNGTVGERMRSHVKKQEVLFLRGEDTFLYQVFC